MPKSSLSKKILWLMVVLVVLAFAAYGFVFFDIRNKNQNISRLSHEIETFDKKISLLRGVENTVQEVTPFINTIQSYFVQPDSVVDFIELVERTGRDSGVDVTVGSVEEEKNDDKNKIEEKLHLRFETRATWNNTKHFLELVENLPYKITLDQVSLALLGSAGAGPSDEKQERLWRGSFDLTVLKLK